MAGRKQTAGVTFTAEQRKWLDAIKDHIASSLTIEQDDLEDVPFNPIGGLGPGVRTVRRQARRHPR